MSSFGKSVLPAILFLGAICYFMISASDAPSLLTQEVVSTQKPKENPTSSESGDGLALVYPSVEGNTERAFVSPPVITSQESASIPHHQQPDAIQQALDRWMPERSEEKIRDYRIQQLAKYSALSFPLGYGAIAPDSADAASLESEEAEIEFAENPAALVSNPYVELRDTLADRAGSSNLEEQEMEKAMRVQKYLGAVKHF